MPTLMYLLESCQKSASRPITLLKEYAGPVQGAAKKELTDTLNELTPHLAEQGLQCFKTRAAALLTDLRETYSDAQRAHENEDFLRYFSNYIYRLENFLPTVAAAKGLKDAVKAFDAKNDEGMYQLTPSIAVDALTDNAKVRAAARDDLERKLAAEAADRTIQQRILNGNSLVKTLARRTSPHYLHDKRIDNMVCVVTNMTTGNTAEGRAGHGIDRDELESLLKAKLGLKQVKISTSPATMNTVANTVNCAEWQALWRILEKDPPKVIRGESPDAFSELYFAAAVPGARGGLIPPCDNCKRLMNFLFAKAFGYTPAARTDAVG